MASVEHKIRTPREKPDHTGQAPSPQPTPVVDKTPTETEQKPDRLSRLAFTVWIVAFAFLGSLALWDLMTALLFR